MSIAAYQTYSLQQSQQSVGSHYLEMEINTAGPIHLVLILYRGAIKYLKRSLDCFAEGSIEGRIESIKRASAMISELHSTLDFKRGQPIAGSLERLYSYIQRRLLEANLQQNPAAVEESIKLLDTLASAWEEVQIKQERHEMESERVELSA